MRSFKLAFVLLFGLVVLVSFVPLKALATDLLVNGGLNDPYVNISGRVWNSINESVATGWQYFYVPDSTYLADQDAKKLHWLSSAQFATAFGGTDYHLEGNRAQNMWSSYQFDAGVYQQVTGLTPGQSYGFDMAMVTYWRGPGFADSDGKMVKQVGIDPTGGTDPTGSQVIWSSSDSNDKAWVYMDVAATAQASTITVFARVQAPENSSSNHTDLDMVYFEAAHMASVPTVTLTIFPSSSTLVSLSWSSGSPPSGWSLKGYEVQYCDQAEGEWLTLQSKSSQNTLGSFTGQLGHTYLVRARAWQKTSESYNSDIDMPGVWTEGTITLGAVVSGQVTTNRGDGIGNATVVAGLGSASATTDTTGSYTLSLPSAGQYTFTVDPLAGWTVPTSAPLSVQLNSTSLYSFTMVPPDNVISNGDFENGLTDWLVETGSPEIITTDQRSGAKSLHLTNTATISQTGIISGSYRPGLSFWYRLTGGDGDDVFTAELFGPDALTPANTFTVSSAGVWQHAWLPLDLAKVYTGPVTVRFNLSQTGSTGATADLDEVSLGQSWGGANEVYLPLVLK